ncbi:TetR/AcrR family transcriptional regulator [Candidatus Contubernalis alkalaceticus]|uniref:TetR/AcrR family transcriptional regulator n=1 Tax=Candidatus Contubernalis alkaliaceticus TaxID=338645 RepID=UPI00296230B4
MLNAAYKEFAEQGYKQASTNRIVKDAGIGKGMLFYYFKSKEELFHYLIDYGINFVIDKYLNQLDESEPDFIERYKQAAQVKMKALNENSFIFSFFGSLYVNEEVELPDGLTARLFEVRKLADSKRLNNLDMSLFRDDVAPDLTCKLIQWSLEGYERELIVRLKGQKLTSIDYDPYWEEFYDYLAVLKKIFYKLEV